MEAHGILFLRAELGRQEEEREMLNVIKPECFKQINQVDCIVISLLLEVDKNIHLKNFLNHFSKKLRTHPNSTFEGVDKVALVIKAGKQGYLCKAERTSTDKVFCPLNFKP